mgnify:CR=1 FL=1
MRILGYEITRARNYAEPPREYNSGKFVWSVETPQIIPANIEQFVASLQAGRSAYSQERSYIYDMYQNAIDFDSTLNAALKKRALATSGKRLEYAVGGVAVSAGAVLDSPRFVQFVEDIIMAVQFWGMGLFDIRLKSWNGQQLFDYVQIPIKHIDPYQQMVRVNQYTSSKGDQYYGDVRTAVFVGRPDIGGLGLQATLLALYKRETINRWTNYIRLAGNNFERIKYRGAIPDPLRRQQTLDALQARQAGSVDLPADVDVEFNNLSSSSQNELFEGAVKYFNDELTKLILGQTMTTTDGSSRSQAEVHERVQETIFDADAKLVLDVLNYEMAELMPMFGLPLGGRWRFVENGGTKSAAMADLDLKLKELGVVWTDEELRKRYNLQ